MASLIPSGSASGTGSMTLSAPVTNSNQTATLPDATGTVMVSGNMPAFSAYLGSPQSVTSGVTTKCTLDTEIFDTNNNFASSRFTPTIAGYYQIDCTMRYSIGSAFIANASITIFKNGSDYNRVAQLNIGTNAQFSGDQTLSGSAIVYCNGTTDYIEMYGLLTGTTGATPLFQYAANYATCSMSGSLVRSA